MGGTRTTFRTNLVLLLRQYFSEYSTQSPIYYEISLFWLLGTWSIYSQPVCVVGILQPASFQWFFPWPWRVFSWTCTDQFSVKIWGELFANLWCSLCSSPSLVFCPVNFSHIGLLELSTLSFELRETAMLCLGSPSCSANWDNCDAYLCLFPFS